MTIKTPEDFSSYIKFVSSIDCHEEQQDFSVVPREFHHESSPDLESQSLFITGPRLEQIILYEHCIYIIHPDRYTDKIILSLPKSLQGTSYLICMNKMIKLAVGINFNKILLQNDIHFGGYFFNSSVTKTVLA